VKGSGGSFNKRSDSEVLRDPVSGLSPEVRLNPQRARKRLQPLANAGGSPPGTTSPVVPTIAAESPTSVTTQGTPHAIASAMALEYPSP
jgi:hypothetical protein